MKCPKCQFENSDDAKFCNECGNKLEIVCSKCGKANSLGSKFCNECGHKLDSPTKDSPRPLSPEEKIEKIQKYLPKGIAEKILTQKDRIEGERKQVTVMFCDMQGFTGLSDKIDPEEVYSIMDQVYEILIHKVHDYEGTVNELTGDGIMALFGAPIALEDAPQRAIRSAYSIHREMTRYNDRIKQEKPKLPPLKMRIGIHTGPVVVGTLGNDLRVEFKAVGDTVNLASRMEGLAEPGSTYVTEDTFKLTEGFFRFEALGEKAVKGKEEPVNAYQVIAPSTRRTRFDVSAERGLTPFVGREGELELLLDGFERAKKGHGQAFSMMSEAGGGKSRLLYEFRKSVAYEDVTFLEGKCLSYSKGTPYHPIIDILKSNFDIKESDSDSEIKEKVTSGLKILEVDVASTLPYLLELLSVKDSGIDKIFMSPEARKERILEALKRIALKGSEIRPLIMAIEDLHWIDKSSEDSIKDLFESISGARILLIITYRPEFVHTWSGRSYQNQITLNQLSNSDCLAIAAHLLGTEYIDSKLEEVILEKSEGIPFFIEELIKSFLDLNIIERKNNKYFIAKDVQSAVIPSMIQDVIMARVDRLPEAVRKVLQTGSVIEREFSYKLLNRVTGISQDELLMHLSVLKDSELLYERGLYPQSAYVFKHALTQEVVYNSILTNRKKRLHEEIARAIEELYKDNIGEHYGVLSEHFIEADNYEKGAEYSKLAGRKAQRESAFVDAISYAKKAVSCLEKLPKTDEIQKKIIVARTLLGTYNRTLNYHIEAKEAVSPIIDSALSIGNKKSISNIYTIMGAYYSHVEDDYPKAFEYFEKAAEICEEIGDVFLLTNVYFWHGTARSYNCEYEKALYYFGKGLDINLMVKNFSGIAVFRSTISFFVYYFQGNINLAFQTSDEAIRVAEESGDIFSKGMAYNSHGVSCYGKGLLEQAIEHFLTAIKIFDRTKFFSWNAAAHWFLGEICFEYEEYQESKDQYIMAKDFLEQNKILPSFMNLNKMALSRAKVKKDENDIVLESLFSFENKNKLMWFSGIMPRYIGDILLTIDDHHTLESEDWIKKAIEEDRTNGMMFHLAQDYALYSEWFKRRGDLSKAKETLIKAIEIFKECGADGWVERNEKELTALS
jgi:class 3 adenylate cyclase/tetratricopeptide (TPR) repeat protein